MKFILNSFIKSYCSITIFIIINRTFSKYIFTILSYYNILLQNMFHLY